EGLRLINRPQQNNWYLAVGALLILLVTGREGDQLRPQLLAEFRLSHFGNGRQMPVADLQRDLRMTLEIEKPSGMIIKSGIGSDDHIAALMLKVPQRRGMLFASLPTCGGQQQHW